MKKFITNAKLSHLLISSLILVGILPALTVGMISTYLAQEALTEQSYNQLNTIRAIKSKQIESFFAERKSDIAVLVDVINTNYNEASEIMILMNHGQTDNVVNYLDKLRLELELLSKSENTIRAVEEFTGAFESDGKSTDTFLWELTERVYGKHIDEFTRQFNWYDAFLINLNGDILYTTEREQDLAKNLNAPLIKGSGLEQAFNQAKSKQNDKGVIYFGDFTAYQPSNNEPAGFFLTKVYDESEKHIGYVALQFPIDKFSELLNNDKDTHNFIVGKDKHLRSNTPKLSVKKAFIDDIKILEDFDWSTQHDDEVFITRDSEGELVIATSKKIVIDEQTNWLVYSEQIIDKALIFSSQGKDFYQSYIEKYGYYDLFLVEPKGEIFYTPLKESDYKTNIYTGPYSDSSLARLIKEVAKTNDYGIADFEPYAPSNDEPAAFIAQPVFDDNGEIEMFVALQLSLEAINDVMQLRDGMGETGESYLVGPDNRMRSDSYLDPENHSVKASFAGSVQDNGVDTVATQKALNGLSGAEIITDYIGNPVLSAYSPLQIGDLTWALIAEIDESEAFSAVNNIRQTLIIIFVTTIVLTIFIAVYLANSIKRPIGGEPKEMIALAAKVAQGDLTQKFDDSIADDTLYGSLRNMSVNLKELVGKILESSTMLSSTAEETSVASDQTTSAIATQHSDIEQVADAVSQMSTTTQEVAQSTSLAAIESEKATTATNDGIIALKDNLYSINQLISSVNKTTEDVHLLTDKSNEIDKVLLVIQEIAEQTNLLALNAAIEAARAGDHGRGFAVVADEVRTLAQRTQESATEIQTMISDIQNAARSVTSNIEVSAENARTTGEQSERTQHAFDGITEAISSIDSMMAQISTASEEQAAVTEDINQKILNINEVSLQTATSSEELSAASQEVARSAEQLTELTRRFTV